MPEKKAEKIREIMIIGISDIRNYNLPLSLNLF
jgi:hypothetical protein